MTLTPNSTHVRFKHDPWPFDARYPNAWRGDTVLVFRVPLFTVRIRWFYAHRENDWMHVDGYKRINISPRWAKWFSIASYYAGNSRNMYHVTVGHFEVSVFPSSKSIAEVL